MRTMRSEGRHRWRRRLGGVAATVLTTGTVLVVAPITTGAVTGSPSSFESSDGNMTVQTTGDTDWNCFANGVTAGFVGSGITVGSTCSNKLVAANANAIHPDANNGANGEVTWKSGQKMDTTCPTLNDNGSVPSKDDFTDIASYVEQDSASPPNTYLYGGEIRSVANGNSSGNLELSQVAGSAACPIVRTAGDWLLAFDFTSGGTVLDFHALAWITPTSPDEGGNSGTCNISHDSPPCWGANVISSGSVVNGNVVSVGSCGTTTDDVDGCSNPSAITNPAENGISGKALAADQFAEFGVNLTKVLGLSGCNAFAQKTWESRSSGSSFTSNPEDIEIQGQPISTCGSITIIKHTNPRGQNQSFGYTTGGLTPSPFNLNDSCAVATGAVTNGSSNVSTSSAFFTAGEGITDSMDFLPAGTTVVSIGGGGTTAVLSANATGTSTADQFTINSCAGNTETFSNVAAGSYSVSENAAPGGYQFDNVTCTNNGAALTSGGGEVTVTGQMVDITLHPNDNVVCTYVNDQLGTITIVKHTDVRGIDQNFSYTSDITSASASASGGTGSDGTGSAAPTAFGLNDKLGTDGSNNTETITGVPAGTYTVTEGTEPAGWSLESLSCVPSSGASSGKQDSAGSPQADITLAFGGSVTCTYQNKQPLGAIQILKVSSKAAATPLAGAKFELCTNAPPASGSYTCTAPSGVTNPLTTDSNGQICVTGLPWFGTGTDYYVQETAAPAGYAMDTANHTVLVDADATSCPSSGGTQATVTVKDVPLTDLTITAASEAVGGTSSTITCTPQGSATNIGNSPQSGATATVVANDTAPNADALTPGIYTCTVNVDP